MNPLVNDQLRVILGRVIYGLVLWVVISSTLEQFAGLNTDLLGFHPSIFHFVAGTVALTAATFEAVTLKGISGLRDVWQRRDPLADVVNRPYKFSQAMEKDLEEIRKLAKQ